jgi:hypothetical protein
MQVYKSVPMLCLLVLSPPAFADVRVERLRADWAALQDARHDFAHRAATLSPGETSDYRDYIDRLRRRLADGCAALTAAAVSLPPEISCPQASPQIAPAPIDQHAEHTRTEATEALDEELGAGLGAFDQRLLHEQERVRAKSTASAGRGGAGAAGGGAGGTAAGDGSTSAAQRAGTDAALEQPPETVAGTSGARSASAPPADVPDGRDDDVVARQLREAAEQETDPELRKKLWDEYRRYKQGVR